MELFDVLKARAGVPVDDPLAMLFARKAAAPGYRFVEYLKSTGTQYVLTDIVPDYSMKVVLDVKLGGTVKSSTNDGRRLFGYSNRDSAFTVIADDDYNEGDYDWASYYVGFEWVSGQSWDMQIKNLKVTDRSIVIAQRGTCSWGNSTCTTANREITKQQPTTGMPVFGIYKWAMDDFEPFTRRDMYLYSLKIYDGETLLHELLPAERQSDNALGLYDNVTRKLYPGTGTFQKGDYFEPYQTSDGLVLKTSNAQIYLVKEES
jgi:hypothetical protein